MAARFAPPRRTALRVGRKPKGSRYLGKDSRQELRGVENGGVGLYIVGLVPNVISVRTCLASGCPKPVGLNGSRLKPGAVLLRIMLLQSILWQQVSISLGDVEG